MFNRERHDILNINATHKYPFNFFFSKMTWIGHRVFLEHLIEFHLLYFPFDSIDWGWTCTLTRCRFIIDLIRFKTMRNREGLFETKSKHSEDGLWRAKKMDRGSKWRRIRIGTKVAALLFSPVWGQQTVRVETLEFMKTLAVEHADTSFFSPGPLVFFT